VAVGSDVARRRFGRVELRATNGDTSEVIILTREAAALRCVELAAQGWRVEIIDLGHEAVPDDPGSAERRRPS
jgi:hypothetical protein